MKIKARTKVSLYLPSLVGGGAERVFVQLANQFCSFNMLVDMVLASAHGPFLEELRDEVRVVDLKSTGVASSLPSLIRYLRAERPQALLSGLDHANMIAIVANKLSRCGARSIISIRSMPSMAYEIAGTSRSRLLMEACKVIYRFADATIANSNAVSTDFCRFFHIRGDRVCVIYNPIAVNRIRGLCGEEIGHAWLNEHEAPVILSVGRLDVLKGFTTLIRAFAMVRQEFDCRLAILGEGPERGRLEDLVKELGLGTDVYLPGFVDNPFAWMGRAKMFVSSSLTEGCPNAVMQALACGTPVISTDSPGGAAEVLEGGKWGALVPVGDHRAMAREIVSVLESANEPDSTARMKDFSEAEIARRFLTVMLPQCSCPTDFH